jgi:hypothetical protein
VSAVLTFLGVTCAVAIVANIILVLVELVTAYGDPSPIPTPYDRRIVGVIAILAVAIALVMARNHYLARKSLNEWAIASLVAALVIGTAFVANDKIREHQYLADASAHFPRVSDSVLRDAGHQACDWLRGRHWGTVTGVSKKAAHRFFHAKNDYMLGAPLPKPLNRINNATRFLAIDYLGYIKRQAREPPNEPLMSRDAQLKFAVTFYAWYELCPVQHWLHNPVDSDE